MAQTNDGEMLRALIRLFPPARRLREDLERITQTEVYEGIGDVSIRSFQRLLDSLAQITTDPYVKSLTPDLPENSTDKEKAWQAFLAAGQLVAYLEAQTGVVAGSGGSSAAHQAPPFHIGELHLPAVKTLTPGSRIAAVIAKAVEGEEDAESQR